MDVISWRVSVAHTGQICYIVFNTATQKGRNKMLEELSDKRSVRVVTTGSDMNGWEVRTLHPITGVQITRGIGSSRSSAREDAGLTPTRLTSTTSRR